mmetsp:Transcript_2382/g.7952  ORF Transcript_2382/g.7952 Transcript_2382/m.7952 type:complete len:150 (+) Transcript_2382:2587-3036(+)
MCQSLARRLGAHIQADPFANPLLSVSAEELRRTDAAWGRLCDDRGVWMDPIISRIVGAAPEGRKAGVSQELHGMQLELACAETRPAPPPLRQLVQAMFFCSETAAQDRKMVFLKVVLVGLASPRGLTVRCFPQEYFSPTPPFHFRCVGP